MKLPQLSLRELFLLVALVAMGCGWWVDRQQMDERLRKRDENWETGWAMYHRFDGNRKWEADLDDVRIKVHSLDSSNP